MSIVNATEIEYYWDLHPTEEDELSESERHSKLARQLSLVLEWMLRAEGWFVSVNLNIHQTAEYKDKPASPDVAVYKTVLELRPDEDIKSWSMAQPGRPAPAVVFEIVSDDSVGRDLSTKPDIYARMGVKELYCYDPRPLKRRRTPRLHGWKMVDGRAVKMTPGPDGSLWSEELNCRLVPDGAMLRLVDRLGEQHLTAEEAERKEKEQERAAKEQERAAREQERAAREQERAAREQERAAKDAALAKLEQERRATEQERLAKEAVIAELERLRAELREIAANPKNEKP